MAPGENSELFGAQYYAHGCGEPYERNETWMSLFRGFAEHIARDIQPRTVLDAGCAMGFLVECLRLNGVEAYGVDISPYAIQNVHESIKPYCWVGSITDAFPQKYDLIVSIEVLEHLPPEESRTAIENICRHTDDLLFSSTPDDYVEATHFNVLPPERWAELFAHQGFYRDVDFDASFLTPWAARYRRKVEPIHRLVLDYERKFWQLWKENVDLRKLVGEMRQELQEVNAENSKARQHIHDLETELRDFHSSRSWQLLESLARLKRRVFPNKRP
jgi:hypothetical protein